MMSELQDEQDIDKYMACLADLRGHKIFLKKCKQNGHSPNREIALF